MTFTSRLDPGVELHSSWRVTASSRVMRVELSLLMVFFMKCWKENIVKGCRV